MKFLSKVSYSLNDKIAVDELLSGVDNPDDIACLICYCTEEYSTLAVQRYLVDALPNTPIHGCTTCHGIMTETGFHSGPVIGVLIIYDSGINAYGTGIEHFGDSIHHSTFNAIDRALKNANREGEIPDLILLHSTPGNEEKVMAAIDKKFGTEVPIIGGSAADNQVSGNWSIFTEESLSINGVSLTVVFASQSIYSSFSVGVIGNSGAGKTTLGKMLVGSILPTSGNVRLDLMDLRNWDSRQLGENIGYVPQDVQLFPGSIKANIARMRSDAKDEDIHRAAVLADVHNMIAMLPHGYETMVQADGSPLSGGQKQRIALAY
jgi:ABC-type multidrug transport system fused ATPase/permease subunit